MATTSASQEEEYPMSQLDVCWPDEGETGAGWCTFWGAELDRCGFSCAAAGERARAVAMYKKGFMVMMSMRDGR